MKYRQFTAFYNRNNSVSIEIQTLKEDIEEELKNY